MLCSPVVRFIPDEDPIAIGSGDAAATGFKIKVYTTMKILIASFLVLIDRRNANLMSVQLLKLSSLRGTACSDFSEKQSPCRLVR